MALAVTPAFEYADCFRAVRRDDPSDEKAGSDYPYLLNIETASFS
jgi:hypothetical protein